MYTILSLITVATLAICGPEKNIITEELEIKKQTISKKEKNVIYKKVPTKWVKITKKSN
tara:strand:+ start:438 stop:614 length:177 start_codon:yes stop_codon:yes gene_type:complete